MTLRPPGRVGPQRSTRTTAQREEELRREELHGRDVADGGCWFGVASTLPDSALALGDSFWVAALEPDVRPFVTDTVLIGARDAAAASGTVSVAVYRALRSEIVAGRLIGRQIASVSSSALTGTMANVQLTLPMNITVDRRLGLYFVGLMGSSADIEVAGRASKITEAFEDTSLSALPTSWQYGDGGLIARSLNVPFARLLTKIGKRVLCD